MTDDAARKLYADTIERMMRAALEHFARTGSQGMLFADLEEKMSKQAGVVWPDGVRPVVIAPLRNVVNEWALNEPARAFCQAMIDATDDRATYEQTRAVLRRLTHAQPLAPDSETLH